MTWFKIHLPGLAFVFVPAMAAYGLGLLVPLVGGPVFGIVLGMVISTFFRKPAAAAKGIVFTSKKILQWAIITLGAGISLDQVWKTGLESLAVMLFSLAAAFAAAYGFGRLLKIDGKLKTLIGVGTAICGGSAIAAVSPIIEADESEIAYSVSTIFLFNIVAVLVFPFVGHLLDFTDKAFGLWAGTAINDTSSVVAAGYVYSNSAGAYATIVKLTRTTMIIPICFLYAIAVGVRKKREAAEKREGNIPFSIVRIFPWFILWFLVASLFHTLGFFPPAVLAGLGWLSKFMIVMALTAVGLSADFRKMLRTGVKPLLLGLLVWLSVIAASLIVQWITGQV